MKAEILVINCWTHTAELVARIEPKLCSWMVLFIRDGYSHSTNSLSGKVASARAGDPNRADLSSVLEYILSFQNFRFSSFLANHYLYFIILDLYPRSKNILITKINPISLWEQLCTTWFFWHTKKRLDLITRYTRNKFVTLKQIKVTHLIM